MRKLLMTLLTSLSFILCSSTYARQLSQGIDPTRLANVSCARSFLHLNQQREDLMRLHQRAQQSRADFEHLRALERHSEAMTAFAEHRRAAAAFNAERDRLQQEIDDYNDSTCVAENTVNPRA